MQNDLLLIKGEIKNRKTEWEAVGRCAGSLVLFHKRHEKKNSRRRRQ